MIRLELARGPFLRPVLVRAVRAAGVQAGIDVGLLATAASAAEAVASAWDAGASEGPMCVAIDREPGSVSVAFAFADHAAARRARSAPGLPPGDGPADRLSAVLREAPHRPGWELMLVVA